MNNDHVFTKTLFEQIVLRFTIISLREDYTKHIRKVIVFIIIYWLVNVSQIIVKS